MIPSSFRAALAPVRSLTNPAAAFDEAGDGARWVSAGSAVVLLAALGLFAVPRMLALLATAAAPVADPLREAHAHVLRTGLSRLVWVERLLPPVPILLAAVIAGLIAAPILSTNGVAGRRVAVVLGLGLSPLLVQRVGELALVWLSDPAGLSPGEVVRLPARFNLGAGGVLGILGVATRGWRSVAAEAANLIGVWVVLLWAFGLSRLDRGPARSAPVWPYLLAPMAYASGFALHAAVLPLYLGVVMGAP